MYARHRCGDYAAVSATRWSSGAARAGAVIRQPWLARRYAGLPAVICSPSLPFRASIVLTDAGESIKSSIGLTIRVCADRGDQPVRVERLDHVLNRPAFHTLAAVF